VQRRLVLALATLAALVAAAVARADKIAFNPADQKTAHAIVLRAADFGAGWKGGARKPDLSNSDLDCASLKGTQPSLVTTGAAETDFSNGPLDFESEAEVLRNAAMVRADFRAALQPGMNACLRQKLPKVFGKEGKLISLSRASLPRITSLVGGFRIVVDATARGATLRFDMDVLFVGKGRTELTLTTLAPDAARTIARGAELKFLRLMASRTPAS
jgi:hypothetical protein